MLQDRARRHLGRHQRGAEPPARAAASPPSARTQGFTDDPRRSRCTRTARARCGSAPTARACGACADGRFTRATAADGLPSDDRARHRARTGEGGLWVGTEAGLSRPARRPLHGLRQGRRPAQRPGVRDPGGPRAARSGSGPTGAGWCRVADGRFTAPGHARDGPAQQRRVRAPRGRGRAALVDRHRRRRAAPAAGRPGRGLHRAGRPLRRPGGADPRRPPAAALDELEPRRLPRARKRELAELRRGRAERACASAAYGVADGMPSAECHGGSQPAGWRDARRAAVVPDAARAWRWSTPRGCRATPLPPPVVDRGGAGGPPAVRPARPRSAAARPARLRVPLHGAELRWRRSKVRFQYRLEGLDRGLGGRGHAARRLLHAAAAGPLPLPREGRQQRRPLERGGRGRWPSTCRRASSRRAGSWRWRSWPRLGLARWAASACALRHLRRRAAGAGGAGGSAHPRPARSPGAGRGGARAGRGRQPRQERASWPT